jgi:hypothetical protein
MRRIVLVALLTVSSPAMAQWHDAQGHIETGPEFATRGDFAAMQIATTDPERLENDWAQPTPVVAVQTQDAATRNQPIMSFIIFRGCRADADGNCHVTARFEIRDPRGKLYSSPREVSAWDRPAPSHGNLQLSTAGIGLRVEDGEPLGGYSVIAQVTDHVSGITLKTQKTLSISEAPVAGGWSTIPDPASDAGVLAAAQAMLEAIPVKNAKLDGIETAIRQVVAGTNYRLTVRLTDGSRWNTVIWRRPDGTFTVSLPARLQ